MTQKYLLSSANLLITLIAGLLSIALITANPQASFILIPYKPSFASSLCVPNSPLFFSCAPSQNQTQPNKDQQIKTQKMQEPKRLWTGFEGTADISYRTAKDLGLNEPRGIIVTHVYPESPAKKAGLKIGDVILKVDNKTITPSGNLPAYIAHEKKIGQALNLTVFRNAATLTNDSNLVLASAPDILTFEDPNNDIERIQFPYEWTKVIQTQVQEEGVGEAEEQRSDKTRLTLFSPNVDGTDTFQERVVLTIDDSLLSSLPEITLDQYLNVVINSYRHELGNFGFKLIDSDTKNVKLSGSPAYMFVYNYTDPEYGTIQEQEVGTIVDDKLFYITYLAKAEEYPAYMSTVQDIINSFQITEDQTEGIGAQQEEGEREGRELIQEIGGYENFIITASGKSINLSRSVGYSDNAAVSASGDNVYVVWNDNSTGRSDIYFTKSIDGGVTFSTPQNLNTKIIAADGLNNVTSRASFTDINDIPVESLGANIFSLGDNLVYITWTGKMESPSARSSNKDVETNYDIFLVKSKDGGATFSKPINVSNNYGISTLPQLFAVYSPPLNSSDSPQSHESNNNTENANNNTVYIVWEDNSSLNDEIYLAKSTDGGSTFSKPVNISNNAGDSRKPSITATPGVSDTPSYNNSFKVDQANTKIDNTTPIEGSSYYSIHVAWEDTSLGRTNDILISNSIDGGLTFSKPVRLPVNSTQIPSSPSVIVPNGLSIVNSNNSNNNKESPLYVVWKGIEIFEGNDDIYLSMSADGGKTFTNKTVNISNGTGGDSFSPKVAAISSGSEYADNDRTPGSESLLASSNGQIGNVSINNNSSLYVVWEEDLSSDPEIFLSHSNDGGSTFSKPFNLSNNTGNSFSPSVAAASSSRTGENEESVYIVWNDGTSANSDVLLSFFSRSK